MIPYISIFLLGLLIGTWLGVFIALRGRDVTVGKLIEQNLELQAQYLYLVKKLSKYEKDDDGIQQDLAL